MELYSLLKKCPLFAGLDNEQLKQLLKIAQHKNYSKGELLFAEGQSAKGFYLTLCGKIKIYKLSPEGKEQILHIVSPGEPFAEVALFSGISSYPAFAETLTNSEVFYFPKSEFVDLLKNNPQLSLNMLATMSQFLRRFNHMIERLSLQDVSARLAQFLIQEIPLGNNQQHPLITLTMTKTQLASQLGTVSETLSRTLKKFKQEGIIAVNGKCITILDQEALRNLIGFDTKYVDFIHDC